jgi:hypothetical protein
MLRCVVLPGLQLSKMSCGHCVACYINLNWFCFKVSKNFMTFSRTLAAYFPHCLSPTQKKVSLKTRPQDVTKFQAYFHYNYVGVSTKHTIALHIGSKTHWYPCTSPFHSKVCLFHLSNRSNYLFPYAFYELLWSIKGDGDHGPVPRALVTVWKWDAGPGSVPLPVDLR